MTWFNAENVPQCSAQCNQISPGALYAYHQRHFDSRIPASLSIDITTESTYEGTVFFHFFLLADSSFYLQNAGAM